MTKADPGRRSQQELEMNSPNLLQAFSVPVGYMQIFVILACLAAYAAGRRTFLPLCLSLQAGHVLGRLKVKRLRLRLPLSLELPALPPRIFLPHSRYNSGNVISVPR